MNQLLKFSLTAVFAATGLSQSSAQTNVYRAPNDQAPFELLSDFSSTQPQRQSRCVPCVDPKVAPVASSPVKPQTVESSILQRLVAPQTLPTKIVTEEKPVTLTTSEPAAPVFAKPQRVELVKKYLIANDVTISQKEQTADENTAEFLFDNASPKMVEVTQVTEELEPLIEEGFEVATELHEEVQQQLSQDKQKLELLAPADGFSDELLAKTLDLPIQDTPQSPQELTITAPVEDIQTKTPFLTVQEIPSVDSVEKESSIEMLAPVVPQPKSMVLESKAFVSRSHSEPEPKIDSAVGAFAFPEATTATSAAATAGVATVATKAITPTTTAKVNRQNHKRKKAAGIGWGYLPLLLLPLLGWLCWGFFGGKKRRTEETFSETTSSQASSSTQFVEAETKTAAATLSVVTPTEEVTAGTRRELTGQTTAISSNIEAELPSSNTTAMPTVALSGKTVSEASVKETDVAKSGVAQTSSKFETAAQVESTKADSTNQLELFEPTQTLDSETIKTQYVADKTSTRGSVDASEEGSFEKQSNLRIVGGYDVTDEPSSTTQERAESVSYDAQAQPKEVVNSDFESLPVCADQLTASSNSETSFVPTPVSQNERNACDCDGDCQCGTKRTQGESCQLESSVESDDLTKIRGIGPATAELLRNSGITTFASLQAASPNRLQQILSNGDDKFKLIDSSRWTQQAKFATNSDWSGLKRWQHKNVVTTEGVSTQSSVSSAATSSATSTGSKAADDLTRIYGIGSATAALLRESGITSFASLQATDQSRLQQILSNGGVKFNLVDPSYWTQQAKFAMDGDWSGLMVWQHKNVISTSERQSPSNSDNRTNASVATSSQRDDLTKILGIGPASQKLLRRNNIQSFEQVASMSSQELDEIFKQQSRFSMLDTSTWPQQAQAIIASDPELNEEASLLDELREIRDIASSSTPSVESATIDTPVTTNEQS